MIICNNPNKKFYIYILKNTIQNLLRKPFTINCYFRADFNDQWYWILKTSDHKYHYSFIKFIIFICTNVPSALKFFLSEGTFHQALSHSLDKDDFFPESDFTTVIDSPPPLWIFSNKEKGGYGNFFRSNL